MNSIADVAKWQQAVIEDAFLVTRFCPGCSRYVYDGEHDSDCKMIRARQIIDACERAEKNLADERGAE